MVLVELGAEVGGHAGADEVIGDVVAVIDDSEVFEMVDALRDGVFDVVAGAFVITWLRETSSFLREAWRVLKTGGLYVALAEPDYEGVIDHPPAASSRDLVVEAVRRRGGDSAAGRKLPALLSGVGFDVFRFGVLNSAWTASRWAEEEDEELRLLKRLTGADGEGLQAVARARRDAISSGERCYFLPIFFAAAKKGRA